MLLGYNTNGFAHHRLDDAIAILAELGYRSVAITVDHHAINPFEPGWRREAERVRGLLQRLGLRSVVETGARYLLDPRRKHQPTLLDPDPAARLRRLDFLKKCVEIAELVGSDAVSFWSGAPCSSLAERAAAAPPAPQDEVRRSAGASALLSRLAEGCRELLDFAAPRGVPLAFEPEPGMLVETLGDFRALLELVDDPHFGLTIDVGHLHCNGEGDIASHLHTWREGLYNVHIEDMRRGVHEHLMFGEGEIDFAPVMRALAEIGYSRGVHVELSRHSHNAPEAARRAYHYLTALHSTELS